MKHKPRFRKGKKAIVSTPRQTKLHNRYVRAVNRFNEGKKNAFRIIIAAMSAAAGVARMQHIKASKGTPQQKAIIMAQTVIDTAIGVQKAMAYEFSL
ncbi:MAG: hypothetical protein KW793_03930 [Candidatus Doudnabacteria bacterium]|nr:hypothetical protein [Candidatus Doudnabacteria bacterium]